MAGVEVLWPANHPGGDAGVRQLYRYPPELARPFVRANFVASVDGAVTLAGRSGGLSDPADREVFALQRSLCDIILVGAGTVRAEGYRGVQPHEVDLALRAGLGLDPVPTIAVVTASCWLTPLHPLVADSVVPPVVITVSSAPPAARDALVDAGVTVLLAGTATVDVALAVRLLGQHGLHRVLCEGGPSLFTELVEADQLDELCLTVSPHLVAGQAGRIAGGLTERDGRVQLVSVVHHDDTLLLRYQRRQ